MPEMSQDLRRRSRLVILAWLRRRNTLLPGRAMVHGDSMFTRRNWLAAAALVASRRAVCAAGIPGFDDGPANAQARQRAVQAVMQSLQRTALVRDTELWVEFDLSDLGQVPQPPSGGFVQPLVPRAAHAPLRRGVFQIDLFTPDASTLRPADGSGAGWRGEVTLRVHQYRIYDFSSRQWTPWKLQAIQFWTWTAEDLGDHIGLVSKTDATYGTFDGGPTQYIAAVFNVPVSRVRCRPAQMQ